MVGLPYGEVRRMFERATLCGLYDNDSAAAQPGAAQQALVLNPPDEVLIEVGLMSPYPMPHAAVRNMQARWRLHGGMP